MKLLSYTGTRPGIAGIGNRLVRWRLGSPYSHSEVMLEPSDIEAARYVPDGILTPDSDGAVWCMSSSATDLMPTWNNKRKRRAGAKGGVRFKRIVVNPDNWEIQDYPFNAESVARWFYTYEGSPYDWRHIYSFLGTIPNAIFPQDQSKYTCSEACAAAASFIHAEVFNPHNLNIVTTRINGVIRDTDYADYKVVMPA